MCGHRCFNTTVANRCVKQRFRGDLHDTKSVNNGFCKRRFFPFILISQKTLHFIKPHMCEKTSSVTEDVWAAIGCFCRFAHCRKTVKIRFRELSARCEKLSSVTEDVWVDIGCFCRFAHCRKTVKIRIWVLSARCEKLSSVTEDVFAA